MLQCVLRSVSSSAMSSQVSTLVAHTRLVHYGIDPHMAVRQGPMLYSVDKDFYVPTRRHLDVPWRAMLCSLTIGRVDLTQVSACPCGAVPCVSTGYQEPCCAALRCVTLRYAVLHLACSPSLLVTSSVLPPHLLVGETVPRVRGCAWATPATTAYHNLPCDTYPSTRG